MRRRRRDPLNHDPSGVHFALFIAALAIIIAIMAYYNIR